MKRILLISALTVLACLNMQAQKNKRSTTVVFTPQWTAQSQFAGYYVAQELGYYREEGLNVQIAHPNATQGSDERIKSNTSQITTLQLAQAMQLIDQGTPLVNLLQTSMNNGLLIVSRRNMNPMEQKGAKVALWRAGFTQLVECAANEADLQFEWVRAANMINLFVAGAVDASVAMSYNEYYQILQAGIKITEYNIYRFADHDCNIQEDGLYVTREYYKTHKEQADKFARASRRGWEYAAEHPEEALEIVMKYVRRNNIATNRIIQGKMLEEILRLQLDPDSGEREFRIRPDMLEKANDLMLRNGELSRAITMEDLSR